jgi:hypothetical protein
MLICDERIRNLNYTQLIAESVSYQEENKIKTQELEGIINTIKKAIINYLGLNIMPIEDTETGKLRMPEGDEFLPLSALIASPELLSELGKKHQELKNVKEAEESIEKEGYIFESPEELEEFMGESDIDFIDDPEEFRKHIIWNSAETKATLESFVIPTEELEDPWEVLEKESANSVRKNRKVVVD